MDSSKRVVTTGLSVLIAAMVIIVATLSFDLLTMPGIPETEVATPSTAPAINFSVNPGTITAGQSATLSWNVTNATSCVGSGAWSGSKPLSGSMSISPTASATYTLTCTNSRRSAHRSVNLTVASATSYTLSATGGTGGVVSPNGTFSVAAGSSQTFTMTPNSGYQLTGLTVDGSSVTPATTYTFSNIAANHTLSAIFSVPAAPGLTFAATNSTINTTELSDLLWTGTNVTSCTAGGGWTGTQQTSGSLTVSPLQTKTYTLTCTNAAGASVTRSVTITVNTGAGLTQCSDGIDNDGDGLIDMADPGCTSPSDNDEYNSPITGGSIFYIRPGATGSNNGSDWNNAYSAIPASLQRGVTYYLASGSYGAHNFNDPVSGTDVITIKKATGSDHGTDIGWQSAYGSGPALWTNAVITITTSHYVFDGATGTANNDNYGFKSQVVDPLTYYNTYHPLGSIYFENYANQNITDVMVKHFDVSTGGSDPAGYPTSTPGLAPIYAASNFPGGSYITFANDYIHDTTNSPVNIAKVDHFTLTNSWLARNRSTGGLQGQHASGIGLMSPVTNVTISNNVMEDLEGTGVITAYDRGTPSSSNWNIFGNVIFGTSNPNYDGVGQGVLDANGSDGTNPAVGMQNIYFYNNTIVNVKGQAGVNCYVLNCSNINAFNNLWYQSTNNTAYVAGFVAGPDPHTYQANHDYNTFLNYTIEWDTVQAAHESFVNSGAVNPFSSLSGLNFRLNAATAAGQTFPSPFNIDPTGATRGADGNWDRGAFEF